MSSPVLRGVQQLTQDVTALERAVLGINQNLRAADDVLSEIADRCAAMTKVVDELAGQPGRVASEIRAIQIARVEEQAAASIAAVQKALDEGTVIQIETPPSSENDIVSLTFTAADGKPQYPAHNAFALRDLVPAVREAVMSATPGTTLEVPGMPGRSITVDAVYKNAPPKTDQPSA